MPRSRLFAALALLVALTNIPAVFANVRLKATVPGAESTVRPPMELRLRFSERVKASNARVRISADNGLVVKIGEIRKAADDSKVLIVTLEQPLPAGHYRVKWRVSSTDAQHSEGRYGFTVAH
jgi:methionine-rich copper-binding protein CopC